MFWVNILKINNQLYSYTLNLFTYSCLEWFEYTETSDRSFKAAFLLLFYFIANFTG